MEHEQDLRNLIANIAEQAGVPRHDVAVRYRCWGDAKWSWSVHIELKVRTQRGQRKDRRVSASGLSHSLDEAGRLALEDVQAYRLLHERVTS